MTSKLRLSASVDAELVLAGHRAVAAGAAQNLSAWVNDALRQQAERDRRLQALGELVADYEAEHGAITDAEIAEVTRSLRDRAVVVRGGGRTSAQRSDG